MTTAQLSITPPPTVADVLGALTDESRIGQVDFSTRLAPVADHEARRPVAVAVATAVEGAVPGPFAPVVEDDPEPARGAPTEPEAVAPAPAPAVDSPDPDSPDPERGPEPDVAAADEETNVESSASVEEVARLVIERMHDAELAMMRHVEAVEQEAARKRELLTAQAELDAELIRLNARREAHGIVAAARMLAGDERADSDASRRFSELTDSLSRFADDVDALHPSDPRTRRSP